MTVVSNSWQPTLAESKIQSFFEEDGLKVARKNPPENSAPRVLYFGIQFIGQVANTAISSQSLSENLRKVSEECLCQIYN